MLSLALLYTLLSTLGWSGFDVIRKRLTEGLSAAQLVVWVNLVQVPGFIVWCAVEELRFEPGYLTYYWGTLFVNLLAHLLFLQSVKLSPLSTTVPLLSLTPVFASVLGVLFFAEPSSFQQWCGVGFVVLGALMLGATAADLRQPWRLLTTLVRERGSLYMTLVAFLWSLAPFFDKRALAHASVGLHAALLSGGVAATMALLLALTGNRQSLASVGRHKGLFALSALCSIVAFGCQLLAIQLMAVGLFEGLKRGLGMILAIAGGRIFFAEPLNAPKLSSVALMALGVVLLV